MEREEMEIQGMQGFQLTYMAFVKVSSFGVEHTVPFEPVRFRWCYHFNRVDAVEHDTLPCKVSLVKDDSSFRVFKKLDAVPNRRFCRKYLCICLIDNAE